MGEKKYRAKQIYQALYQRRIKSIQEIHNIPNELKKRLADKYYIPEIKLIQKLNSTDGTQKFQFEIDLEKEVEAVWIPSQKEDRFTICVSSQVGCSLNCAFCATGKLDFKGNLLPYQILEQIIQIEKIVQNKATNIVFMGMGEPMYNYDSVIRAASILHDPDAFNLSAKRITISTAGVTTGIKRWIEEKQPFNLAISLNHPDPNQRKTIMPIDEKFPLRDLLDVLGQYTRETDRRVTLEYIMIPQINMDRISAKALIQIASKLKSKVNLIPLHTNFHGWNSPTELEINNFINLLKDSHITVMRRRSAGRDIHGACGMLALKDQSLKKG